MESLNAFWSTVASKMYDSAKHEEDATSSESTEGTDTKKKKEGEIEDADFEVVD
jgi:hypothetical protein